MSLVNNDFDIKTAFGENAGENTDELFRLLLLKLLNKQSDTDSRFDRLQMALIEGMKRSRSRTFGSNQ